MMTIDIERIVREEVRELLRQSLANSFPATLPGFVEYRTTADKADTIPAPPPEPVRTGSVPAPKPAKRKPGRPPKAKASTTAASLTGAELLEAAMADIRAGSWTSASVLAANVGHGVTPRQAGDVLQRLVKQGRIVARGSRRTTRYWLPDQAPPVGSADLGPPEETAPLTISDGDAMDFAAT